MKNIAILQARCSSTRLPGKVLKLLHGKPMILQQIARIQKSKCIDELIVATSTDESDDPLVEICKNENITVSRGSLNDVLDRFYSCIKDLDCDNIIRLTADCPLTDYVILDQVINSHIKHNADYTSNCLIPTYPDGLDIEVLKKDILEDAWREAKLPSEREHVTPFIYNNDKRYKVHIVKNEINLSSLRWTVDEQEDLDFVSLVYQNLYKNNEMFLMNDILNLIENNNEIKIINTKFERNEGLLKSLKKDQEQK